MSDNDPKFTKPGDDPAPAGAVAKPQRLKPWVATAAILATLTVTVDSPGADVTVDPGPHSVEARMGARVATMQVDAQPGSTRALALSVKEPPPVVKPPPPPKAKPSLPLIVAGAGVSAVAVGTGIALLAVSAGKASSASTTLSGVTTSHTRCASPPQAGPCSDVLSLRESEDTLHNAGVPLVVTGGVVAAGTLAYALWPRSAATAHSGHVEVLPMAGPQGGGLWLHGSF